MAAVKVKDTPDVPDAARDSALGSFFDLVQCDAHRAVSAPGDSRAEGRDNHGHSQANASPITT